MATLLAGPHSVSFLVHRNLLVSHSSFFKAALTSEFEEANTNIICLPEQDPEIVGLFVQWCYTGDPHYSRFAGHKLIQLIQLYEFADKYMIPRLHNDLIWVLFALRHDQHTLPKAAVKYAFTQLPDTCPLLALLAAWYVWHAASAKLLTRKDLESLLSFSIELNFQNFAKIHEGKVDPFMKDPGVFYEKICSSTSGNDILSAETGKAEEAEAPDSKGDESFSFALSAAPDFG